jgi:Ca2+-binding EF-hand superfamily protein
MRWIAKMMLGTPGGRQLRLETAERQMLLVYKSMNNDGLPRFNELALQLDQSNRAPRQRAQSIARFLEKDLDNDGKVTTDELKTFLEPQSRMMLQSTTGIQIEPTAEQMDQIIQQLLAKNLQADTNGDGTIDFEEMRASAAQATAFSTRISSFRLADPVIIKLLDTSGDKTVSQEEFLTAVRKTFAAMDLDKNGLVDATESCSADVKYVKPKTQGIYTCF